VRCEASHLLVEQFSDFLCGFGADVAARGEDMAVFSDLVERGGLAEAGDVRVFARLGYGVLLAAPGAVSGGVPYCQRMSSLSSSPRQSLTLKGGLARM
jgi:hypothetical protein